MKYVKILYDNSFIYAVLTEIGFQLLEIDLQNNPRMTDVFIPKDNAEIVDLYSIAEFDIEKIIKEKNANDK